jgi:imidazolonepropionase-like amidohydrolase
MRLRRSLLLLCLFNAALPVSAADLAIVGATVLDGNGGPPLRNATVVVSGSQITAFGPKASTPVLIGATVVDGARRFVLPGFIKQHRFSSSTA